jgi:hypothetical protein
VSRVRHGVTGKPTTHEQELRAAIRAARLPARDFRIYDALFARAHWNSAVIYGRYQPRSLTELADWCRMSRANLCYGLNHLEYHGWIERRRWRTPGRGHRTMYALLAGRDCEPGCPLKKAAKDWTLPSRESVQQSSSKASNDFRAAAGQEPVSAKRVSDEEGVKKSVPVGEFRGTEDLERVRESWKGWPAGSNGEYENRRPT